MELFSLTTNTTITDIKWQAYPIGFFLLLLCLFTIFGNLLIIYAIIRDYTLHTSKYYYIASLAFADLLVGLIVMPFAFIFEMTDDEYWLFPRHLQFLCDFWHSTDIFASTASILGLSVIGLDRYVAITKPITHPNSFISKRWYYMFSFIWICSAVISFPALTHWGTEQVFSHLGGSSMSNETTSTPSWLFKECDYPNNPYYILFLSIISFYLPLILMIYVYIQVYLAAKKQIQAFRSGYKHHYSVQSSRSFIPKFSLKEISTKKRSKIKTTIEISNNNTPKKSTVLLENRRPSFQLITLRIHRGKYQNPSLEPLNCNNQHDNKSVNKIRRKSVPTNKFWRKISEDQKAAKVIGIIMGVFVICWLPFCVYNTSSGVFYFRLKDERNHELLYKILAWLAYTNSALDIIVYIFTSKELRATLFKLFCKS